MDIEQAFDQFGPRLFAYLRRLGLSIEDSDEGVSEIFLRAMKSRIDWDQPSSYLYKIGYHLAMDLFRKPKIEPITETDRGCKDNYEDDFFKPLSLEERSIVLMLYQEKFSYEEISKITNKPVGTLKSLVHRAKEKIKDD